jgi:hypothetical protein
MYEKILKLRFKDLQETRKSVIVSIGFIFYYLQYSKLTLISILTINSLNKTCHKLRDDSDGFSFLRKRYNHDWKIQIKINISRKLF